MLPNKYCETCGHIVDPEKLSKYASGRFCSKLCARRSPKKSSETEYTEQKKSGSEQSEPVKKKFNHHQCG